MPEKASAAEIIFYDGRCGLCHGFVRFVATRTCAGAEFEFAPLGGEHFRRHIPEAGRAALPDSIVLRTSTGELLVRSAAVLHVMRRLGGVWRVLAGMAAVFPAAIGDSVYDWIARVRRRMFRVPADVCPVLPPELKSRFHP